MDKIHSLTGMLDHYNDGDKENMSVKIFETEKRIRKISRLKPSNREILIKTLYVTVSTIVFLVTLGIMGVDTTALTVFKL